MCCLSRGLRDTCRWTGCTGGASPLRRRFGGRAREKPSDGRFPGLGLKTWARMVSEFGHKTRAEDGFQVWALKPGCCGFAKFGPQNSSYGRLVSRFGPQNRGLAEKAGFSVWATKPGVQSGGGTWRQSGGCVEATL